MKYKNMMYFSLIIKERDLLPYYDGKNVQIEHFNHDRYTIYTFVK